MQMNGLVRFDKTAKDSGVTLGFGYGAWVAVVKLHNDLRKIPLQHRKINALKNIPLCALNIDLQDIMCFWIKVIIAQNLLKRRCLAILVDSSELFMKDDIWVLVGRTLNTCVVLKNLVAHICHF